MLQSVGINLCQLSRFSTLLFYRILHLCQHQFWLSVPFVCDLPPFAGAPSPDPFISSRRLKTPCQWNWRGDETQCVTALLLRNETNTSRDERDERHKRNHPDDCRQHTLVFQSTHPVRGGTRSTTSTSGAIAHFNPPAPCGAGQQKCTKLFAYFWRSCQRKRFFIYHYDYNHW